MKVYLEVEITECYKCPFLNCSDTGEDCNLLSSDIQEGAWSNIDFQFDDMWRYKGCPLIHNENMSKYSKVKVKLINYGDDIYGKM